MRAFLDRVSVDVRDHVTTFRRQLGVVGRRCRGDSFVFVVVVPRKTQTSLATTVERQRRLITNVQKKRRQPAKVTQGRDCLVHFLRLLAVCWPVALSAQDNHVLACIIFTDLKKTFTLRLSNKPYLIWLLTTPPYLKYVATLPCNLSLSLVLLTLMFHKVV